MCGPFALVEHPDAVVLSAGWAWQQRGVPQLIVVWGIGSNVSVVVERHLTRTGGACLACKLVCLLLELVACNLPEMGLCGVSMIWREALPCAPGSRVTRLLCGQPDGVCPSHYPTKTCLPEATEAAGAMCSTSVSTACLPSNLCWEGWGPCPLQF